MSFPKPATCVDQNGGGKCELHVISWTTGLGVTALCHCWRGTCLYLANLLCGKMGGRRGGEGRGGKGRRYSLANFKLDQMESSEGLRSGLGYQVGRESMLVCLGRPVNVVCTRVRVLC